MTNTPRAATLATAERVLNELDVMLDQSQKQLAFMESHRVLMNQTREALAEQIRDARKLHLQGRKP